MTVKELQERLAALVAENPEAAGFGVEAYTSGGYMEPVREAYVSESYYGAPTVSLLT